MESYDYMKSMLPIPNHSVSLHAMSGGANNTLNSSSTNITAEPDISPEATETVKENVADAIIDTKVTPEADIILDAPELKTLEVSGFRYMIPIGDITVELLKSNEQLKKIIDDFYLYLLDTDTDRIRFITLMRDAPSIPQPDEFNVLIEILMNKIIVHLNIPTKPYEFNVNDFEYCNVLGDGWCLYRALFLGKYLLDNPDITCNDINTNIYKTEDSGELMEGIQKIKTHIQDNSSNYIDTIMFTISTGDNYKDTRTYDEYLNKMDNSQNKFWGDFQIGGFVFGDMNNILINVYIENDKNTDNNNNKDKYVLNTSNKELLKTTDYKTINILFDRENEHYGVLISKKPQKGGRKRILGKRNKLTTNTSN